MSGIFMLSENDNHDIYIYIYIYIYIQVIKDIMQDMICYITFVKSNYITYVTNAVYNKV